MNSATDRSGHSFQLGKRLGQGGEGAVYEVASDPLLVAKLYHAPLPAPKAEKLEAIAQLSAPELLKVAAWPTSTLYKNGKVVGFLMHRIDPTMRPVHELYTPKTRLKEFPGANWAFLLHVATNIVRGFAVIHRLQHVVGDVNHGNLMVGPKGTTAFIDCDSFQIQRNGKFYLCEVGVSTYTPPELQNKSFASVVRTQNSDAFGMAVLLFHLLFLGRHPYAGRFNGKGDMPIERAIGECRFPFGRLAATMQMSPPPNSLLLTQVSAHVADCFERAFSPDGSKGNVRPTALEWLAALDALQKELQKCARNRAHVYFAKLSSCPWCVIERSGAILFIDLTITATPGMGALNIDELWKRLASLPPIESASLPAFPPFVATPKAEATALGLQRKTHLIAGIATVCVAVAIMALTPINGFLGFMIAIASVTFAVKIQQPITRKREAFKTAHIVCKQRYDRTTAELKEIGEKNDVQAKIRELDRVRTEYKALPLERQRKLQQLEMHKRELQLDAFLDRFQISDATIPNVGPGRKAMLASYNITTAADITWQLGVPGIGTTYTANLMAWRASIEQRFRFDPSRPIDKADIDKLDRDIHSRRLHLEHTLSEGVKEATTMHARVLAHRSVLLAQLERAHRDLLQAKADLEVT